MPEKHLELLSGPTLAGLLGISLFTLNQKRSALPRPLRLGARRFWLRSEVRHLLPRLRYRDAVSATELAGLLHCSVGAVYTLTRNGTLPTPRRVGRRSVWSRRVVERHLSALPR